MKQDKLDGFLWGLIAGAVLAICVVVCALNVQRAAFRRQAVEAGKAEYYLDDKHKRQWRWKP